jgi:hypothetical protein
MSDPVSSFDPYPDFSEYHPFGRNFGSPKVNMLGHLLLGHSYMPKPESGQGAYDAFLQKERSMHFMNLQKSAFSKNPILNNMGLSGGIMNQLGLGAAPDSKISGLMSPVVGGNPMAASMQIYAGLAGSNMMGNYGRHSSITEEETGRTMGALLDKFYKKQSYEGSSMEQITAAGKSADEEGVHQQIVRRNREFLKKRASEGPSGEKYLKDLGIDPKDIDTYDPTEANVSGIRSDLDKYLKESDTKIKDALQKRIKDQVEAQGVASASQIDQAFQDPSGNAVKTMLDTHESKQENISKKITSNLEDRTYTVNHLQTQIAKIEGETDKKKRADYMTRLIEGEDDKDTGQHYKGVKELYDQSDPQQKSQYKDLQKKVGFLSWFGIGRTELDLDKTKEALDKARELTPIEKANLESKEKSDKFKGIDFANTRGYKVEDFSSAFVKANELRALGDRRGGTPEKAMQDFMSNGNAGQFMDAAKSLFGDKSGAQLVEETSKLMGRDKMDLGSTEGVAEASKLLRDAKATARVAGVSLNALFGIIDATSELVKNNPQLQHASQRGITDLSLTAIKTAADIGSSVSAEDFRKMGGSQGIASSYIKEKADYAQSSKGGAMAAFFAAAKAAGNLPEAIEKYKAGEFSAESLNNGKGLKEMARLANTTEAQIVDFGGRHHAAFQAEAMKNTEIFNAVTQGSDKDIMNDMYTVTSMAGSDYTREAIEARFKKVAEEGGSTEEFLDKLQVDVRKKAGAAAGDSLLKYRSTMSRNLIRSTRTDEENKAIDERVEAQSKTQEEISKKYSAINAPIVTQAINALMTGDTSEQTIQNIAGIFAVSDNASPMAPGYEKANKAFKEAGADLRRDSKADISKKLNEINAGRKEASAAIGRSSATADLRTDITEKELDSLMAYGQKFKDTPTLNTEEKRNERLKELEKEEAGGFSGYATKEKKEQARQLLAHFRATKGVLGDLSDEAWQASTSGDRSKLLAGVAGVQTKKEKQRLLDEVKDEGVSTLSEKLAQMSTRHQDAADATKYYEDKYGKDQAAKKMYEDYEQRDSSKATDDNYFKKNKQTLKDKGDFMSTLGRTQEEINNKKNELTGKTSQVNPAQAMQDLNTSLATLTGTLKEGSGIGKELGRIASALEAFKT